MSEQTKPKRKPTAYQVFRQYEDHVFLPLMASEEDQAVQHALNVVHRVLRERAGGGER